MRRDEGIQNIEIGLRACRRSRRHARQRCVQKVRGPTDCETWRSLLRDPQRRIGRAAAGACPIRRSGAIAEMKSSRLSRRFLLAFQNHRSHTSCMRIRAITPQKMISPTVNHPFLLFSCQKPSQTIDASTIGTKAAAVIRPSARSRRRNSAAPASESRRSPADQVSISSQFACVLSVIADAPEFWKISKVSGSIASFTSTVSVTAPGDAGATNSICSGRMPRVTGPSGRSTAQATAPARKIPPRQPRRSCSSPVCP